MSAICKAGKEPSPELDLIGILVLNFEPLELKENNF
jgi:hypothetical protein